MRVRIHMLVALVAASFALEGVAAAQWTIRQPRAHTQYKLELEPHLVLGTAPPGPGTGSGGGVGVRASIVILPEGFISALNDSVAIGFGIDAFHYRGNGQFFGDCTRFEPGPNGTSICTAVDSYGGPTNYLYIPVVMQWSFWFTRQWSAFGEPGLNFFRSSYGGLSVSPALYLGGRLQLTEQIALTLRAGWPAVSLGVSFLL